MNSYADCLYCDKIEKIQNDDYDEKNLFADSVFAKSAVFFLLNLNRPTNYHGFVFTKKFFFPMSGALYADGEMITSFADFVVLYIRKQPH